MSGAYITGSKQYPATKLGSSRKRARKVKEKLTWRQRLRNWLNRDLEDDFESMADQAIEHERLSSEGMRLQIYKANGGYVVETRSYDSHKDRNFNSMHVITEDHDLGDALGKIVMIETLKR